MKKRITEEAIKSLRQEGLRFSVDTLAEKLKISKKTIYKYFPVKEALANAIYERYYADLKDKVKEMLSLNEPERTEKLLLCYFDSAKMVRREIFNKFCLNKVIGDVALQHHLDIWNTIKPFVCSLMTENEAEIYKLITDGSFEKAIAYNVNASAVIGMLRK